MTSENKTGAPKQNHEPNNRNSLIIKIALFLNYLSKDNHQKLILDLEKYEKTSEIDILKIMLAKKYITQQDVNNLKKTCLSFAKAQEDMRFGSLCINFGFLTQSNLDLALEEQKRLAAAGTAIMLGDLLVDAGMLSERQRNLVLQKQKLESGGRKNGLKCDPQKPVNKKETEPEDPPFDKSNMREIREVEIILLIQNDALKAFALKTDDFDTSMLLSDFKFLLEKNGIIYGVVGDDDLNTFIKEDTYKETVFELAKGLEPIDGTDAQIVYMFEKDYLKAGLLAEDGTIDFKARGEIPFVAKGDILAEKIPPKEGKDGINVYGDAILRADARDISFNLGKGVRLSKDELKVLADVEGNPKIKQGGEISVNDAYFIEGDVDYTTGHVKFNKNVYITGTIKNGFRVEAIDVVANTVDGGIIKAEGDVFIQNGVTESTIEAKGNIKAGFMHRSKAACMGDMTVVKEIADTEILLEGTFEMNQGKVLSSSICAKGGAKINNIGSEKAAPSSITVGASVYLEKKLENINATIEKRQNALENKSIDKNKIAAELSTITEKLNNFDQSRHRTISMMEEMKKNAGENQDSKIDLFQKGLDEADKKIHDLSVQKTLLETRLKKINNDIVVSTEAVKASVKEKFTLKRLNQANPPKPILDVAGKVLAGTKINGRYATLILSQNLSRSRIMEINSSNDDGQKKGWEMIITSL
ncbi:MAG: FapA family protein [Proteobacteria bacterium]|nr:FapA family protein [Pseudomonadota bacterium]MBU1581571.1 FapA family protein [Pseudomonadota bacterium]